MTFTCQARSDITRRYERSLRRKKMYLASLEIMLSCRNHSGTSSLSRGIHLASVQLLRQAATLLASRPLLLLSGGAIASCCWLAARTHSSARIRCGGLSSPQAELDHPHQLHTLPLRKVHANSIGPLESNGVSGGRRMIKRRYRKIHIRATSHN